MSEVTIYHNPRCSKSRQSLELLKSKSIEPTIIEYLKEGITKESIEDILQKLDLPTESIIRKKEAAFKELGLESANKNQLIKAVVENPILLERPIIINGNRAVIGRPPETINNII